MPALTPPSSPSPSPESPDSLPRSHPFILRTQNLFEFLTNNGLLVDRVRKVLAYMKTQDVNLPILLWAISWNVPELASDPGVSAERTALLISTELPQILACWRKPPRKHNSGIRTKGARDVMEEFAVATVSSIIDREMEALKPIMTSPQEELSEESLLSINWKDMIDQVNRAAPVTWRLFRNAAYTSKQESRNTIKNPDAVSRKSIDRSIVCSFNLVRPHDDRNGILLPFSQPLQATKTHDNLLPRLWTRWQSSRHAPRFWRHHVHKVVV